jgi:large subunit ribosomal protein L21
MGARGMDGSGRLQNGSGIAILRDFAGIGGAHWFGDFVMAYAIIEDSGTQLKVEPGDRFEIDLRELAADQSTITFDKVLLVSGEGGVKIGQPTVAGATVTAKVLGEVKDDKIFVERFTRRKGFHRRVGHRQRYLAVQVEAING